MMITESIIAKAKTLMVAALLSEKYENASLCMRIDIVVVDSAGPPFVMTFMIS